MNAARARSGSTRLEAISAAQRGVACAVVGVVAGAAMAAFLPWQATVLLAWDVALVLFLSLVWTAVWAMDAAATSQHAVREDSSETSARSVMVGAALACLGAVGLILVKASSSHGGTKAFLVSVGVISVVLSWMALHSTFTLRYARLYYSGRAGGVDFNQSEPPTYVDFAYLAFTIGMTFQVSDTDLESPNIRKTALRHGLVSYVFGAVIVGLIINVVASLLH